MKPTMFFLINSIDLVRGGLTRASLKQASSFAESGYDVYMLTFNFNPRYPLIRKELLRMNKVHRNVRILNMYEDLEGHRKPRIRSKPDKPPLQALPQGLTIDKRKHHNAYRIYDNGMYIRYISLDNDGFPEFTDHFNENGHRTKRETYDPWGNIKKIAYMDLIWNKPSQLIYYGDSGKAFLTQWVDPENNNLQHIQLFGKDLTVTDSNINDILSLKIKWLTEKIDQLEKNKSVVISDSRPTDQVLIGLNQPEAAKILRMHSNHLKQPFTDESELTSKASFGMSHLEYFDTAIFLTEEQKNDVEYRFGKKTTYRVIPHFHNPSKTSPVSFFNKRKEIDKRCIVISRLSSLKRIDHTIKAFREVVRKMPDAQLEIWGTGDQEKPLRKLIKQLKLGKNVSLKGYTHHPDAIYQKALFTVLTSKSEGFALSVMESMNNETPVISYDVKYGPADMIEDGRNGFIVDNGSIEQLTDRMIYLFEHPGQAREMGKRARKHIHSYYNEKAYKRKWKETVSAALDNQTRRARK